MSHVKTIILPPNMTVSDAKREREKFNPQKKSWDSNRPSQRLLALRHKLTAEELQRLEYI